ncbi:hypothetical protein [Citrobacter freundii]|uniref:hypothetical protein n=1 Tax=Citrobacter freundii TaxID=546 RepID=UPI00388E9199
MSNVLQKENIIMSLPHRDWSCEVIECRLKVCPVPDELDRGNNIFFIVEDLYQLRENSESLNVLGQILAKRFPHIPPKRMHLVLHVSVQREPSGHNLMYSTKWCTPNSGGNQSVRYAEKCDFRQA